MDDGSMPTRGSIQITAAPSAIQAGPVSKIRQPEADGGRQNDDKSGLLRRRPCRLNCVSGIPDTAGKKEPADYWNGDHGYNADYRKIGDQIFGVGEFDPVNALRRAQPAEIGDGGRQNREAWINGTGRNRETHPSAAPASGLEAYLIRQRHEDRHHNNDASGVGGNDETQNCSDDGYAAQNAEVTAREYSEKTACKGVAKTGFLYGGTDDQSAEDHPDGGRVKTREYRLRAGICKHHS